MSEGRVALVTFAGIIPLLLLSSVGGALADRFERRHLLIVTQILTRYLRYKLTPTVMPTLAMRCGSSSTRAARPDLLLTAKITPSRSSPARASSKA